MADVVLENVSKVYPPGIAAVSGLNLCVADGELVVLVGPSGCGKTTTLRLIAGLEEPTEGILGIGGRVVNQLPPRERKVAMVFQRPALYPHMTVRRNLAFGLELQRSCLRRTAEDGEIHDRVAEVAHLLQLEEFLDRRPNQLSGGQQQRVALGRALVRQPAVLLLDEPLSHLDARLRAEMRRELHLLHKRLLATMIYVTHDPVEAMTLADRVVVLDRGEVQQADRPQVVFDRPRNRRVAGFFGWPPMNLLDGTVLCKEGRSWFTTTGGTLSLPLPREWEDGLEAGRALLLGIRPEHLGLLPPRGRIEGNGLTRGPVLDVVLVETLGAASLVTLQREGVRLTAMMAGTDQPTDGQSMGVVFDMDRAHLFDGASGQALRHGSRTG
jgi:multiple sugar transport system ATP-binding protein